MPSVLVQMTEEIEVASGNLALGAGSADQGLGPYHPEVLFDSLQGAVQ